MATRPPLVRLGGKTRQMPAGDAVPISAGGTGASSASSALSALGGVPLAGFVTMTGSLGVASPHTMVYGDGVLLGPRFLSGSINAYPGNWYRLCAFSTANAGYATEFYFVIPSTHLMLKVRFTKTTRAGVYGGGILRVEVLGSWGYGFSHPYMWRVVDNGTNGETYIDFRFSSADGRALEFQIHQLYTIKNGADMLFPLNSMGPANGTGATNFGFVMGAGAGEGWSSQEFILNATNGAYAALSNTFVRTTGIAAAM